MYQVDATNAPTQAPRVRVLLGELLMSLQQCENHLGTYPSERVDFGCVRKPLGSSNTLGFGVDPPI